MSSRRRSECTDRSRVSYVMCCEMSSRRRSECTDRSRVSTFLENLEMSRNLTAVREMSGILLKVREVSLKKSCQGKVA